MASPIKITTKRKTQEALEKFIVNQAKFETKENLRLVKQGKLKAVSERFNILIPNVSKMKSVNSFLDEAWNTYKKVYLEINPRAKPPKENRKQEFKFYYLAGLLEFFDPNDTLPAYLGSDIEIGTNLRIQLKSLGSTFRINYGVRGALTQVSKYGLNGKDPKTILSALIEKIALPENIKEDQNKLKVLYMQIYIDKISPNTNWYIFDLPPNGKFCLSIHKTNMVYFVKNFPEFWKLTPLRSVELKSANIEGIDSKLQYIGNSNFWRLGLTGKRMFIHSVDHLSFYHTRGYLYGGEVIPSSPISSYGKDEIRQYNTNVYTKKNDFLKIQNAFFGSVSYLKNF